MPLATDKRSIIWGIHVKVLIWFFNRTNVKQKIGEMKDSYEDLRQAAELGDDESENYYKRSVNEVLSCSLNL